MMSADSRSRNLPPPGECRAGHAGGGETTKRTPAAVARSAIKGLGYVDLRGRTWWIRYSHHGRDYRESSRSDNPVHAQRLLKERWKHELVEVIDRRWRARECTYRDGGTALSRYVFHRSGQRVAEFRKPWAEACAAAGVPGLLFHDLRRSCVRNLERSGVSQTVAMQITGHRTISVYQRYRITNEDDRREALAKMQASVRNAPGDNVTSIADPREGRA